MSQQKNDEKAAPPLRAVLLAAGLSAIAGFVAVAIYVTSGQTDNVTMGGTAPTEAATGAGTGGQGRTEPDRTASASEDAGSRMKAFVRWPAPKDLPDVAFKDADGGAKRLADFRGKTVLLNLWATWCVPCRHEMPSLDRLQKAMGSEKFQVVALALERGGVAAARKFFDESKIESLSIYVDSSTRAGPALRALGMPTTILIDAEGRELGRLPGPAEWDSADAKKLIEAALR